MNILQTSKIRVIQMSILTNQASIWTPKKTWIDTGIKKTWTRRFWTPAFSESMNRMRTRQTPNSSRRLNMSRWIFPCKTYSAWARNIWRVKFSILFNTKRMPHLTNNISRSKSKRWEERELWFKSSTFPVRSCTSWQMQTKSCWHYSMPQCLMRWGTQQILFTAKISRRTN